MTRVLLSLYLVNVLALLIEECRAFNSNEVFDYTNTSSNCIPGKRQSESQDYMTTTEFIRRNGYEAEEHTVETTDGYILTMHRIPSKVPNAVPVFVQHGVLSSSFDWLVTGKGNAIGFLLADDGYDVWLGNARGNTYSRCHTRYTTSDPEYWDFTFHELGVYDLPAVITYVTNVTDQNIFYIGHSMGTTMFYVMASERPDIAAKVRAMFSLSTVAYMGRMKTPVRLLKRIEHKLLTYPEVFGTYELLSQSPRMKSMLKFACTLTDVQQKLCLEFMFTIFGKSPFQTFYVRIVSTDGDQYTGWNIFQDFHTLSTEVRSKKFRNYDHGIFENLRRYNSVVPPDYNISRIQVPVAVFWSSNDYVSHPLDVFEFYNQLPNPLFIYRVTTPFWNHVDYLFGVDVRTAVNLRVLSALNDFTKKARKYKNKNI